jgi:hypothetical protein
MNEQFSYATFEALTDAELISYAIKVSGGVTVPVSFVDYFRANAAQWDGKRLELALGLLWKSGAEAARHLIADHLNYPLAHIRFTAYGMIGNMAEIDGYIMSRIEEFSRSQDRRKEFVSSEVDRFRAVAMAKLKV